MCVNTAFHSSLHTIYVFWKTALSTHCILDCLVYYVENAPICKYKYLESDKLKKGNIGSIEILSIGKTRLIHNNNPFFFKYNFFSYSQNKDLLGFVLCTCVVCTVVTVFFD